MAYCKNCGKPLQGDERFCVACGTDVSAQTGVTGTATPPGPGPFLPPGIPITLTIPQPVPPKRGGWWKVLLVVGLVVACGYYYLTHLPPAPVDQAADAALVKAQVFNAHWDSTSGYIEVSNGKWTNNATVAVTAATLECDQYDANGANLAQMRTTLNGPVGPGSSATFSPFQMGAVTANLNKVTCAIVHVKTGNKE